MQDFVSDVNNNGDEILKNIGKKRLVKRWSEFQRTNLHVYMNSQTLEEYGLNLLFLFLIIRTLAETGGDYRGDSSLLLLLIVTVTGLIYWYSKDFSSVWNCW